MIKTSTYRFIQSVKLEQIQAQIAELAKKPADLQRWGFLKLEYEPTDETTYAIILPSFGEFGNKIARATFGGPDVEKEFLYFGEDPRDNTPGRVSRANVMKYYNQIEDFFERGVRRLSIRKIASRGIKNPYMQQATQEIETKRGPYQKFDAAPSDNDRLIVFMDEPTAFLSYENQQWFRKILMSLLARYSNRLQIFIATNDASLIEKTPGAGFIYTSRGSAQYTKNLIII